MKGLKLSLLQSKNVENKNTGANPMKPCLKSAYIPILPLGNLHTRVLYKLFHSVIVSWIWYGMILMLGRVVLVGDWLGWTS